MYSDWLVEGSLVGVFTYRALLARVVEEGVRRLKACPPFVSWCLKSFLSVNSACRLYNQNKMIGFYIVK